MLDLATGLEINPDRDYNSTPLARRLYADYYLRDGETVQQGFARASLAWSGGDRELAQRLYDGVSKGWFMFASPVLSNAPLPGEQVKAMPISCFLTHTEDTLESLLSHTTELRWLSVMGGGVGGHWSDVRSVSKKAPGPIPFLHTVDADMEAYMQGTTRKGSYAAYLDVSHPDIMEFIALRTPGGDSSRKCHSKGFHIAVNITDDFMRQVESNGEWHLVDPHDQTVRDTVKARDLWEQMIETRNRTGEPYFFFIDAARRAMPESQKRLGLEINGSNLCSEITLATGPGRTAVCCLSSLNAETYPKWKSTNIVRDLIRMLDNVLSHFILHAPETISRAKYSAMRERSLGLGMMGWNSLLQSQMIPFESEFARKLNKEIFSFVKEEAVAATIALAAELGEAPDMVGTKRRNAHLLAIAPNANSAILLNVSSSTEPWPANVFKQQTRAGTSLMTNRHLENLLESKGMNTPEVWQDILEHEGSVQHLDCLSDFEKKVFKTAIELSQIWIVQHAADRQPFICQAQSVNLFFPARTQRAVIGKVHMLAWKLGLKSLYYLRAKAKNKAEAISQKIDRVALVDAVNEPEETDCVACQG